MAANFTLIAGKLLGSYTHITQLVNPKTLDGKLVALGILFRRINDAIMWIS